MPQGLELLVRAILLLAPLLPVLAARMGRLLGLLLLNVTVILVLAAFGVVPAPLALVPLASTALFVAGWEAAAWAVLAACIVLAVLAVAALLIMVKMTRPPRKKVYEWTPEALGLPYEEFTVRSRDGVELKGWLIRGGGKGPVIVAHGYTSNMGATYTRVAAEGLVRRGYTVALFDFRGHGSSGGSYTTVGPKEAGDLLDVADWLLRKTGASRVALVGYSMGAMASILAASMDERVAVVVADSPPPGLPQAVKRGLTYFAGAPGWLASLLAPFLYLWAYILYGVWPPSYVMWDAAARSHAHLLVVVGDQDPLVTVEEAERIAAAARSAGRDGEVHVVRGAGHVRTVEEPGYVDVVEGFIAGHFGG